MRVLIVKTSSMGDVIHTLPALTDAGKIFPDITFDWVVEESFAEIPGWHPLVKNVIPMAWRRWRKNLLSKQTFQEWRQFQKKLRATHYDLIIDAQGLLKSAVITCIAKGARHGLDWQSAREPLSSIFYQNTYPVLRAQHAITRVRALFSQALQYTLPNTVPDYGIDRKKLAGENSESPYLIFLHGTTWSTKHWPEEYWKDLAKRVNEAGFKVKLPWGNAAEHERASRIAASTAHAEVLPRLNLAGIAKILAGAKAIVAVDTGLCHLAAALDVPTISLYGPTDPALSGALGQSQTHLSANFPCAPCFGKTCTYRSNGGASPSPPSDFKSGLAADAICFTSLAPAVVWGALSAVL